MRVCIKSFAILLTLIAFSPALSIAKEPSGGGHGGGNHGGGAAGGGSHSGGEGGNRSAAVHGNGGPQDGNYQTGNVGGTAINPAMRSNPGNFAGQAAGSHHDYDAQHRPEFSGHGGGGRDDWRYRWDNGRWLFWGADNRWMWYGDNGQWQNYGDAYVVQRPILENFSGGPIKITNPATNNATLSYTLDGNAYTIAPGFSPEFSADRAWVVQFSRGTNLDQARYGLQSGLYSFTSTNHGWELFRSELPR